jgi:hypothetical protein
MRPEKLPLAEDGPRSNEMAPAARKVVDAQRFGCAGQLPVPGLHFHTASFSYQPRSGWQRSEGRRSRRGWVLNLTIPIRMRILAALPAHARIEPPGSVCEVCLLLDVASDLLAGREPNPRFPLDVVH